MVVATGRFELPLDALLRSGTLPLVYVAIGACPEIRTPTYILLRDGPLPVGLGMQWCSSQASILPLLLTKEVSYPMNEKSRRVGVQ